jgi:hypothetical protein
MKDKKSLQLGMNASTAANRLVKDILFSFVQKAGIACYQCEGELFRENFSIEHKTAWLDSEDPQKLFFDLENISFSHRDCNSKARRTSKLSTEEKLDAKERHRSYRQNYMKENYTKEKRKDKYLRTGH